MFDIFLNLMIFSQIILINSQTSVTLSSIKTNINNNINTLTKADLSAKGGSYAFSNDGTKYCGQISFIGNQVNEINNFKFPQVNVTDDCKTKILEKYKAADIVIAKIFKIHDFAANSNNYKAGIESIIDVIYYQFFPFINGKADNNQPIDISSVCSEKVVIFSPLYIEETLKNKFVAVSGQNPKTDIKHLRNYDIFDPDSKIYKDICYPITYSLASENIIEKEDSFKNYDISLYQRKIYYFPGNLMLCPEGYTYLGTDKDTVSPMCECDFNSKYKLSDNFVTEHNTYLSFEFDEEKFNKTKKDNYLSIETFKCIKLPFTKTGFKNNFGSIFILVIIVIVLLSYLILVISGKHHMLSVLELLYNSNIKSMNYIKNAGNANANNLQNPLPYDTRSNNYLLSSQRGIVNNGLLMSSLLTGNNYLNGKNDNKKAKTIKVGKSKNASKNNVQVYNPNAIDINKSKNEKSDIIDDDEEKEKENDKDKTDVGNSKSNDKNDIIVNNEEKKDNEEKEKEKEEEKSKEEEEEEEDGDEEEEKEEDNKDNNKEEEKNNDKEKEEDDEKEEEKNDDKEKENDGKKEKDDEEEDEDEDDEEGEEEEDEDNKKANPPKKSYIKFLIRPHPPKKKSSNGGNDNDEYEKKNKKKKAKSPIEIALNVKDLREMMFKNQPQQARSNDNGNNGQSNMPNMPPNGLGYNPYNMGFMPPPPFPFNEDAIRKEYENKAKQRELEFQKEIAEQKEKERRREMDNMYERERQRERDLYYDRRRDDDYRDRGYNRRREEDLYREKERLNQQNQEVQKMKESLQKEYEEKHLKDKEKDLELQKELSKAKDLIKGKEIDFEKELLKQKQALKEQHEKESKEIIEKKDKELQLLKEEKDREIQRLKEDKDREMKILKEDLGRDKKQQEEKLKKKEKEFKKEKQKLKELQKGMTTNSFFMNGTMQQQMIDLNNTLNKYNEKIETPQIVVPIDSIFTDEELNSMNFSDSFMYDKRTLCQIYTSFINRKQPLFFLFNYNSSSSNSVSTFQINYNSIKYIMFCVELMIYLFFYATFFGSKSVTYILKKQFTFRKRCIFAIILSPFCMIAKSVIHYFVYDNINKKIAEIKMRCYTNFLVGKKKEDEKVNDFKEFWESDVEDKKEDKEAKEKKEEDADLQEIENDNIPEDEKIRRKDKYEKKKLKTLIKDLIALFKKKIWVSFIVMILVMFIEWYYISAFCAVYKNTQLNFFVNILISYIFSNIIPFVYCLIPTIFRQNAVKEQSEISFYIYKVFQII